MAQLLVTRHPKDFDLRRDPLDLSQATYRKVYPGYPDRRSELAQVVGRSEFLWCVSAERGFAKYEMDKLVEWTLRVTADRILGYVHVGRWDQFFHGEDIPLEEIYYRPDPPDGDFDILVPYPLQDGEIVRRVQWRWSSPHKPGRVITDETFCDSAALI